MPNIKEGKGGLRDLNTLFWIAHYVYRVQDQRGTRRGGTVHATGVSSLFRRCEEFLWRVRCHLHLHRRDDAEEKLNFDAQRVIAERLRLRRGTAACPPVERFMKHYFLIAKRGG